VLRRQYFTDESVPKPKLNADRKGDEEYMECEVDELPFQHFVRIEGMERAGGL
jgi:hypothetical protein